MKKEEKKVPQLRFPKFKGDWEQRKFSEGVSEIGDGLHGTPIYCEDGNVYFINGNNLVDGKIVISAETKKVNESQQSTADKSLDDTTILMSINGTIGNLAYYSGERLMLGKSAAYIKVSEFDKRFVYAYLQAPSVQGYFMDSLTGTTIKNLGLKAIREMIMFIPQDVDEQKRIGKFLNHLDHLITLHQRKLEKIKKFKKGVMQKLFSQEVRFKADDGSDFPEWEEKTLSEIASFHSGLTYTPDDVVDSENGVLVFRSSNIQNGRICYDDNVYVDKELKEKNYVRLHDIVVCVRNGSKALVGKNALVTESDLNATWGAFMTVIRTKQNYEFVHQYLNSAFFKKEMYKDSGTATINQITTAMLNGCKLLVPSLPEQQKIADCLSSLDDVIEKQKVTLAAWGKLKKGLLQQMFV